MVPVWQSCGCSTSRSASSRWPTASVPSGLANGLMPTLFATGAARSEGPVPGHSVAMTIRSVGVEEELLLFEPGTGQPLAVAETALRAVDADDGRQEEHARGCRGVTGVRVAAAALLETSTKPCFELSELGEELCRGRRWPPRRRAASARGWRRWPRAPCTSSRNWCARAGTLAWPRVRADAYEAADLRLPRACHVLPDEGVAVLDRIRPTAAGLLGAQRELAFLAGTRQRVRQLPGYQAWSRWPSAGPTGRVRDRRGYRQPGSADGRRTGTLLDSGMVYFDARLSDTIRPSRSGSPTWPVRRRRGAGRRAGAGTGGNRGTPLAGGLCCSRPPRRDAGLAAWPATGPAWTTSC